MDYVAGGTITAGDVVAIAGIGCGIATKSGVSGDIIPIELEGVFEVVSTGAIAQGARVYWNGSAATATGSTNTLMGVAMKAAASNLVQVKLIALGDTEPGNLTQAANVAALGGTLTGTVAGTMVDVAAAACGGTMTPAASDVDTAVAALALSTNLALKELQTAFNAEIAALKAAGLQASS